MTETTTTTVDTFAPILALSAYELSEMAECGTPDTLESIGAKFLTDFRDDFVESVRGSHDEDPELPWTDLTLNLQDNCAYQEWTADALSVYTHPQWQTFVDLCAYEQDISDHGPVETSEQLVMYSMVAIGEQLAARLLAMVDEFEDDAQDDDDES